MSSNTARSSFPIVPWRCRLIKRKRSKRRLPTWVFVIHSSKPRCTTPRWIMRRTSLRREILFSSIHFSGRAPPHQKTAIAKQIVNKLRNFRGFRKFFEVFGLARTCSDLFGCIRMRSDASGCVRMRPDAFGKNSENLIRKSVFAIFTAFWRI